MDYLDAERAAYVQNLQKRRTHGGGRMQGGGGMHGGAQAGGIAQGGGGIQQQQMAGQAGGDFEPQLNNNVQFMYPQQQGMPRVSPKPLEHENPMMRAPQPNPMLGRSPNIPPLMSLQRPNAPQKNNMGMMQPPIMVGAGRQREQANAVTVGPTNETTSDIYYLNKVVESILVIILLGGFFFIPENLQVLWLIIFGLLFLSSVGLQLFGAWISLAKNSNNNDANTYQDAAKYTLYVITIMFASVFIGLLFFFSWKLILFIKDVIEHRRKNGGFGNIFKKSSSVGTAVEL